MSVDSSGEVYLLPFRPSNEHNFTELCGKSASLTLTENDVSKELLEIRITDLMGHDFSDSSFQQSRALSGATASDVMTMVKQEIDFGTLNRLLTKDLHPPRAIDPDCLSQSSLKSEPQGEESSVPVVMYSKDICIVDNDFENTDQVYEDVKVNGDIPLSSDPENLAYSSDENTLNSVEVLGDESVWVSDSKLFSLSDENSDNNIQINHQIDIASTQLVPVKVEDGVVFINVAPSVCDQVKTFPQRDWSDEEKPLLCGADPAIQDRPSVISVAAKTPVEDEEQHASHISTVKFSPELLNQDKKQTSVTQSSLINKAGFHSLFKPKVISSRNSRSLLKASVAGKQKPVKLKSETQDMKEYMNFLPIHYSKRTDLKNLKFKHPRPKAKKPQSLAVVAISSDKTKDLTEIVVSTSKGEQIFKGRTSELISATPSLWCLSSSKGDIPSSSNTDCVDHSQQIGVQEDDEAIDDKPVTDAIRRLGIPALKWIQNKPEDERMWFCPEKGCKRLFPRLYLLKVHILGHYGVRPYKCDFPNCQWAFYTHFKLKRHKETHLQRKDFKCPVPDCGRSFSTIYNLNTHQKLHKRPAEISCPVENCTELFQTRRSLEFHLRQHGTDHAPYICPYSSCQKRYYTVNSVNSHIRSHQHKDDEIKCQWAGCSKVFNKPCRLKAHMRTHTGDKPYPCNHPGCNWAFSSSSKLKRHQHKHTNVRNFECPLEGCGKLFMRSEHLKEHILTHSSERTFKCPHPNCNVKFSAKSSLYVHSKKHKAKISSVPATESNIDTLASIPVNVIRTSGDNDEQVESSGHTDSSKLTIENQAPIPVEIFMCPIEHCGQSFLSVSEMRGHVDQTHSLSTPIAISVGTTATQTLDLIPLLCEDEALVAELASMDSVPFSSEGVPSLRSEENIICTSDLETATSVLSSLPGYIDGSASTNNSNHVVTCSLDREDTPGTDSVEKHEDLDLVLNPASARSSITLHLWIEFKKQRQRQAMPFKHQRQSKRQTQQALRNKKHCSLMQNLEEDHGATQSGRIVNEGLSNLRAPLDVVLGAGLLGSGLLLPDELAASSDIYSSEDGILSMDSSFVPSTINLRDLE